MTEADINVLMKAVADVMRPYVAEAIASATAPLSERIARLEAQNETLTAMIAANKGGKGK
jgi:hypothetical protein